MLCGSFLPMLVGLLPHPFDERDPVLMAAANGGDKGELSFERVESPSFVLAHDGIVFVSLFWKNVV